jgi:hypothetical protein
MTERGETRAAVSISHHSREGGDPVRRGAPDSLVCRVSGATRQPFLANPEAPTRAMASATASSSPPMRRPSVCILRRSSR